MFILLQASLKHNFSNPSQAGLQCSVFVLPWFTLLTNSLSISIQLFSNFIINVAAQSFPTPMEEPKKVMRVQYVGLLQVERPSGMEVLNSAIDRVVEANPPPWRNVSVAVAPSTVTITNTVSLMLLLITGFPQSPKYFIFFWISFNFFWPIVFNDPFLTSGYRNLSNLVYLYEPLCIYQPN